MRCLQHFGPFPWPPNPLHTLFTALCATFGANNSISRPIHSTLRHVWAQKLHVARYLRHFGPLLVAAKSASYAIYTTLSRFRDQQLPCACYLQHFGPLLGPMTPFRALFYSTLGHLLWPTSPLHALLTALWAALGTYK